VSVYAKYLSSAVTDVGTCDILKVEYLWNKCGRNITWNLAIGIATYEG
jgi:hypothetical protein